MSCIQVFLDTALPVIFYVGIVWCVIQCLERADKRRRRHND